MTKPRIYEGEGNVPKMGVKGLTGWRKGDRYYRADYVPCGPHPAITNKGTMRTDRN